MITEDYCSYELAVLLKEKGFDGLCRRYDFEDWQGRHTDTSTILPSNFNKHGGNTSIPTLQMAMKWLREVHNVHIVIEYHEVDGEGFYGWIVKTGSERYHCHQEFSKYYEEAVEAALKYSLKNLI